MALSLFDSKRRSHWKIISIVNFTEFMSGVINAKSYKLIRMEMYE